MVEFDATDDANAELLNKLKHLDVRVETVEANKGICKKSFWKSLKLRAALNHIGLLVGLSVYCGVGGMKNLNELKIDEIEQENDSLSIQIRQHAVKNIKIEQKLLPLKYFVEILRNNLRFK